MTYKLIVMSYQTEPYEFSKVQDAWEHAAVIGSKWYFYPFGFVVDQSETVVGAPDLMTHLEGLSLDGVARHFKEVSLTPEARNVNADEFAFMV